MAQYFTDFSEYTVNQAPSDWSVPSTFSDFATFEIRSSATPSGKILYLDHHLNFLHRLRSWDAVPSSADVEIIARLRCIEGQDAEFGARAQSGPTTYMLGTYINKASARRIINGSFSEFSSAASAVDKSLWYWQRVRVNGSSIKVRLWQDGTEEPATWDIEPTNSDISTAGVVGICGRASSKQVEYDVFGVGTNGDTAPTAPVGGGTTDALTANDVSSTSETDTPAIAQTHSLAINDIDSVSSVDAATLGQNHALSSNDLQSSSELTAPTLAESNNVDTLTANNIESISSVTQATISQSHTLIANGLEALSESGQPTLQQAHQLSAVSIDSLSQVTQPTLASIAGQNNVAANDVESTSETTSPTLAQVHVLQPATIESASKTSAPTLDQIHQITSVSIESVSTLSAPAIRDASQVLTAPIKNTKATVTQSQYRAIAVTKTYKADMIQTNYKVQVA